MAKKRFTDDLFGLFEEPAPTPEATPTEAKSVPAPKTPAASHQEESVEVDVPTKTTKARRKLSSKGFTADLDAFLSDSFEREGTTGQGFKLPLRQGRTVQRERSVSRPA